MKRFNPEFRRFFVRMGIGSGILLILASPLLYFNIIIDPYCIFFDHNEFACYTNENNKRAGKLRYILKYPDRFDSFIFGSSRVNFVDCDRIGEGIFFNMTCSAGAPGDHLRDLRMMIDGGVKVKKVIIGVDYLSFFDPSAENDMKSLRLPYPVTLKEYYDFYKLYILGIPQTGLIKLNIKDYKSNRKDPIGNGQIALKKWDSIISQDPLGHIRSGRVRFPVSDYKREQEYQVGLKNLQELLAFLTEKKIDYVLFIHPTHVAAYLTINLDSYLHLLEKLAQISDFYDFSGLNSVCINHLNFYETSHFSERVGDLIIDRIYNRKNPDLPKDFGIQVNNKNALQQIEQHKAWIDDYFGSISFDQSSWVKLSRVPAQPKTLTGEEALIRIDELVRSANENIFHILSSPYLRLTVRKPLNFNQIPVVFLDQQLLYYRSVNENIGHSFNPVRIIKSGEWELLVPAQRLDTGFHSLSVGYLDTVTGRWSKSPGVFRIRVLHERDYPEGSTISESQSTGSTEKIYFELFSVNGKPGNADQYIVTEPWLNLNGWAVDAHTKLPVDNLVALVNDNPIPILFKQEQTFLAVMFDNAKSKFAGWTTLLPLPKAGNEARIEFARLTDDRKSIIKIGRGFSVSRQLPNDTTLLTGLKKLEFSTQYWIDKINNEKALSKSKHQIGAGSLKISGWAVDHSAGKPAGKVYVKLGNKLFGARYSDPREDVAEHYKNPNYANCGWTAEISTAQIAKGTHLVRLVIVTHDGTSYYLVDQGAKVVIL